MKRQNGKHNSKDHLSVSHSSNREEKDWKALLLLPYFKEEAACCA
jgi:hypothetical protein